MRRTMSERERMQAERLAHEVAKGMQLAIPLCREDLKAVRDKLNSERSSGIRAGWDKEEYLAARSIVVSDDSTLYPKPWVERAVSHIRSGLLWVYILCATSLAWAFGLTSWQVGLVFATTYVMMCISTPWSIVFALGVVVLLKETGVIVVSIGVGMPILALVLEVAVVVTLRHIGQHRVLPRRLESWIYPYGRDDR